MKKVIVVVALALAGPMACAPMQAEAPAVAQRQESARVTARVVAIDLEDRNVVLRAEDGETVEIVAGPEVRNLPQLKVGDVVAVEYARAVAARMADAGDGAATGLVETARAPAGAKPGAASVVALETTFEVVSYDPQTAVARVRDEEGALRSFVVHPEMQAFAASRKPGDKVRVAIVEAVAIGIEPRVN